MSGVLDNVVSEIVRKLMIDLGLCSDENGAVWRSYYDKLPDTADEAICVYCTTGQIENRKMDNGEVQERHGIQVRVRSLINSRGYLKAHTIGTTLDTGVRQTHVTLTEDNGTGSVTYAVQTISRTSDVIPLGAEGESSRRSFTVNFLVNVTILGT